MMVNHLRVHGYKGDADLYYLEPGCIPPDGMVLMSGPEHVEQMMQAHKGKKKCQLYIIRNGSWSDDCDDGMNEEGQFDHFNSWEPIDRWDEGHTHEHGSSQRTEQPASNSHNKALTFSNGNEYMDAECAPH